MGPGRRAATAVGVVTAWTVGVALLLPAPARAQDPVDYGPRRGYVNDLAGVVGEDERNAMEDLASEVRRKSRGDIVVITLDSLAGRQPEEIAAQLTTDWNVGYQGAADDPATGTGTLVILSLAEREFSVQTQEGTRAFLPEAAIRELVAQKVIGPFRAGDYGAGLLETVRGLAQVYAQRFGFVLEGRD